MNAPVPVRNIDRLVAERWRRGEITRLSNESVLKADLTPQDLPPQGDWFATRQAFGPIDEESEYERKTAERLDVHAAIALNEPLDLQGVIDELGLEEEAVMDALATLTSKGQISYSKEARGWVINRKAQGG